MVLSQCAIIVRTGTHPFSTLSDLQKQIDIQKLFTVTHAKSDCSYCHLSLFAINTLTCNTIKVIIGSDNRVTIRKIHPFIVTLSLPI